MINKIKYNIYLFVLVNKIQKLALAPCRMSTKSQLMNWWKEIKAFKFSQWKHKMTFPFPNWYWFGGTLEWNVEGLD